MKMDDSWYMNWYHCEASEDDKELMDKVYEFSPLFNDMLFQPGTSTYDLVKCQYKGEDGDWKDTEFDPPEELAYFAYTFFKFKVDDDIDAEGFYNHHEQLLCLTHETMKQDHAILHEMIHLHESVINELPLYFHDMVYWALYKELRNRIPDLDTMITDHAHILTGSQIYANGGLHDILFLLKSLQLDICKGYPLGTVFAYGREDDFKEYTYIK